MALRSLKACARIDDELKTGCAETCLTVDPWCGRRGVIGVCDTVFDGSRRWIRRGRARDVDEVDAGGQDFCGVEDLGQNL